VSKVSMSKLLVDGWLLAWSVAVALSTILIIASVGYAQKRPVSRQASVDATTGSSGTTYRDTGGRQEVTHSEFLTQWRANGHQSVAALAAELGVNVRTAQRWVKIDEIAQTGNESDREE
jgi:type II secretory pathway component PulJ